MRPPMHVRRRIVSGLVVLVSLSFVIPLLPALAAQTASGCEPGRPPRYAYGFADLHDYLSDTMGDPLTCEFADPNGTGDVHQRTSQGLAFWRKQTNTPTFTNGWDHWAHTSDGWVHWLGASIDPPGLEIGPAVTPTPTVAATTPPTAQPTAGPIPTSTATPVPEITTSKFLDIFRAEGGSTYTNVETGLPFRRVEAAYDNSYRDCPPRPPTSDCIRGRVQSMTIVGPAAAAENLEARSLVYNTFKAERQQAEIDADLTWSGVLAVVVSADSHASTEFHMTVKDAGGRDVPGTPYEIFSSEIGTSLEGLDKVDVRGSRKIAVPVTLHPGETYRIEFMLTCKARAGFNVTTTNCNFGGAARNSTNYAEWTKLQVVYDRGLCLPSQSGPGCIYSQ